MAAEKNRSANSVRILVFAPPKMCLHQKEKKARLDAQESEPKWDKTYFKFDGSTFINVEEAKVQRSREDSCNIIEPGVSECSGIVLEYDAKFVQDSINSYLDQEFVHSTRATHQSLCNSFVHVESVLSQERLGSFERLQQEYEKVNFESKILLNSILSRGSSRESAQGDDNTHQLTEDDVYTQVRTREGVNENDKNIPNPSPSSEKRPKVTAVESTESKSLSTSPSNLQSTSNSIMPKQDQENAPAPRKPSSSTSQSKIIHHHRCALPKISDKLAYLTECNKLKDLVNICVIVLQVNPVKEIQIKSGINKGQYIPLSSIIVADVSKSVFKLTLWRQASSWTERIVPGDIIIATAIRIESWRDENIGQTTFNSCFYNLHQPVKPLSRDWLQLVSQEQLDQLMTHARQAYGYLFRNAAPPVRQQVKFTRISEMQNNTVIHFRGVLRKIEIMTANQAKNGDTYRYGNQRLPKIKIVFAQSPDEEIGVSLWGRQAEWLEDLRKTEGTVWELQYLTAKHDASSGTTVLHTTPKSTKTKLTKENPRAKALLSLFSYIPGEVTVFKCIKDLFEAKFSGSAKIQGFISSIMFRSDADEVLNIQNSQDVKGLTEMLPRLTYVGCASCSRPLNQDKNRIYGQCAYCVYHKPDYNYKIARFYRNFTINFQDSDRGCIEVDVKHSSASKLFRGIEANQLVETKNQDCRTPFVESVEELVSIRKEYSIILFCHIVSDENSFVVSRSFTLLDI